MKRVTPVLAILLIIPTSGVIAQTETLLGEQLKTGSYWGLTGKLTDICGEFAVMNGIEAAGVFNNSYALGFIACNLTTDHTIAPRNTDLNLDFDYWGFFFEYIHKPDLLVHGCGVIVIAAGNLDLKDPSLSGDNDVAEDILLVIEPTAKVELNVSESFRIGFGLGYRYVTGMRTSIRENIGLEASELSGFTANFNLRFGRY